MQSLLRSEKAQLYVLFAILVLSASFGNMSQTALNAMLPHVISEFGISMAVGQWLTTIYMLAFGITVPLATFLSKRLSLRVLVCISSSFSIVGLTIAAFSQGFVMLFVGRVCQAVATGLVLPLMQTTAMVRFPPHKRATALGVASIAMGSAPTAGPSLGGLMDTSFGWRSFFILLVAVSLLLLISALLFISSEEASEKELKFESPSFLLSSLGFGGLLLAFSDASNFDLGSPFVWAPFIVGVFCLVLFVRRQKKVADPLISMQIFSFRRYRNSFLALNAMFAAHMAIILMISLYIQNVRGGTSLDAGLILLPGISAALFMAPLSGYLTDRIGIRPVALVAGLCLLIGSVSMVFLDESTPFFMVTLYQTIRQIGASGLVSPLTSYGLSTVPREKVTDGSSFLLATRQTAAALGTAAAVFVLTTVSAAGSAPIAGFHLAFAMTAFITIGTFAIIFVRVR